MSDPAPHPRPAGPAASRAAGGPEAAAAFDELFAGCPVMAILRGYPPAEAVALATRAWDLGITAVEVPVASPAAFDALAAVVAAGRDRGRPVGAGTVVSAHQVRRAAELGAAFTVAPGLDAEVVERSAQAGLPHLPGVATPTEVQQARRLGLIWLKAFPAVALGPAWFTALAGPFPEVQLVATGGMDAATAPAYLRAGARVVAVGSALADPAQVDALAGLLAR